MLNRCLLAASLVLLLQGSIDCKALANEPTLGSSKENGGVSSNDIFKTDTSTDAPSDSTVAETTSIIGDTSTDAPSDSTVAETTSIIGDTSTDAPSDSTVAETPSIIGEETSTDAPPDSTVTVTPSIVGEGTCMTDEDCYDRETCNANGVCECVDGTRGDHCEEVTGCGDLRDACEEADADCVFDADAPTKATCKCRERGKKYDNESKVCRETCDDFANKCRNGAECEGSGSDVRFCACRKGTSGDLCDVVDDCEDESFCGTDQDVFPVFCVYDVDSSRAECECVDARKRFNPTAKRCQGPCDDDGNWCRNGAECRGSGNATFCACKPGTSGDLCDVVDACEVESFCGQRGDAHCKYNVKLSKAECICKDKAKKFHHKEKICRETCRKRDDCYWGQSCSSDGFCVCPEGFEGVGCKEVAGCRELQKVCDAINADCVFDVNSRNLANCRCREGNAKYDPETRSCEVAVYWEHNMPSVLFIIILSGIAVILFMSVLFIVLYAFSRRRRSTV